jgi:hypothetical protein
MASALPGRISHPGRPTQPAILPEAGSARKIQLETTIAATAAATAISPTSTAVPPTAAVAAPASAATTFARTRFIDDNVAAHQILTIERLHRASGLFVIGHFDETKAAKLPGGLISNQRDGGRGNARLREPVDQVLFGSLERQIAYIKFFHRDSPFDLWRSATTNV